MKNGWMILLSVLLCVGLMSGCESQGYKNSVQTGPAVSGAGEKPGIFVKGEKNLLGEKVEVKVTTEGKFSAESITYDPSTKSLDVKKPSIEPTNMVALTDAGTNQIANALLKMSQQQTTYGQTVSLPMVREVMTPAQLIASAVPVLVGNQLQMKLSNGMTFEGSSILSPEQWAKLVEKLMTGVNNIAATFKSPASQPAAKSIVATAQTQ